MNLPNQLTMARLVLCGFFVLSMSIPWPYAATTAFLIFSLASITDWLDGMIARRYNLITDLGKLLDPLADKILISTAFISLIELKLAPMWMVVAIIAREFLITGLRIIAANKHLILAAERAGKHKTVSQIITVLTSLGYLTLGEFGLHDSQVAVALKAALPPLIWITLVITVVSGGLYFYKNRFLFDRIEESVGSNSTPSSPDATTSAASGTIQAADQPSPFYPAFKEWGVIVEALGRGGQIVILRKGGIAEGRQGFQIKHRRFWLFPTQYHQQLDKTKPGANAYTAACKPNPHSIVLRYFAEITDVRYVDSLEKLAAIDSFHLWKKEVVEERYNYGAETGLHVIVVRVRRLFHPYTLKPNPAYDGCKSWVEVPANFEAEPSSPVLKDEDFNSQREQLLSHL
jgi:CDP-diacylglycerol---glycerol-3-phosphate 3-phosphatidyltransferase